MWPLFSFLVLIALLIIVHEFGHFLAAKSFGINVKVISFGFGKKLIAWKKGTTEYCISMIPLGGYVKMEGEPFSNDIDEPQEVSPTSFKDRPAWQRAIVVFAGPFANLLLSMVVFSSVFAISGIPSLKAIVGMVSEDGPAMVAGILPGDKFLSVNGQKIERWEDLTSGLQVTKSNPAKLEILRDGEVIETTVVPAPFSTEVDTNQEVKYIIGIRASMEYEYEKMSIIRAIGVGAEKTCETTYLTAVTVGQMFTGGISLSNLNGPVRIAQLSERTARQGFVQFLFFVSVISTGLALMNLIPIPVLDGGHLAFLLFEAVTGKCPSKKLADIFGRVGIVMISLVMSIALFNDIKGIF